MVVARVRSWWTVNHRFCTMPQLLGSTVSGPVVYALSFLVSEFKTKVRLDADTATVSAVYMWLQMVGDGLLNI